MMSNTCIFFCIYTHTSRAMTSSHARVLYSDEDSAPRYSMHASSLNLKVAKTKQKHKSTHLL